MAHLMYLLGGLGTILLQDYHFLLCMRFLVGCAHHTVSHLPFLIGENRERENCLNLCVDFNAQVNMLRSKQDMWQHDQKLVMIFNILLSQQHNFYSILTFFLYFFSCWILWHQQPYSATNDGECWPIRSLHSYNWPITGDGFLHIRLADSPLAGHGPVLLEVRLSSPWYLPLTSLSRYLAMISTTAIIPVLACYK